MMRVALSGHDIFQKKMFFLIVSANYEILYEMRPEENIAVILNLRHERLAPRCTIINCPVSTIC